MSLARLTTRLRAGVAVALVSAVLAACGGGGGGAEPTADPAAPAPAPAPTVPPANPGAPGAPSGETPSPSTPVPSTPANPATPTGPVTPTTPGPGTPTKPATPTQPATDPLAVSSHALRLRAGNTVATGNLDGTGQGAYFHRPKGIVAGPDNTLYIGDENQVIRKVQADGKVTTFAGTHGDPPYIVPGLQGETSRIDGSPSAARFANPRQLVLARDGSMYVADARELQPTLRRITADGFVTSYPIGTPTATSSIGSIAVAPQGGVYVFASGAIFHFTPETGYVLYAGAVLGSGGNIDGPRLNARFEVGGTDRTAMAVDKAGNLYMSTDGSCTVRKVSVDGMVSTLGAHRQCSRADGNGTNARFEFPRGMAADAQGNVWVLDKDKQPRRIAPDGTVSTPMPALTNLWPGDWSGTIAFDAAGKMYATHEYGVAIVQANGDATPLAGQALPVTPPLGDVKRLAADTGGRTLVLSRGAADWRVRRIDASGADTGVPLPQLPPHLSGYSGMAVDASGNTIVSEQAYGDTGFMNSFMRGGALLQVTPSGQVSTLARWTPTATALGPMAVATNGNDIYFVDGVRGDIVRWTAEGGSQVFLAYSSYNSEAYAPTSYAFALPRALAFSRGELFMLHKGALLKVVDKTVQTVVPKTQFKSPTDLAADANGHVYVADVEVLWRVSPGKQPQALAGTRGQVGLQLGTAPGTLNTLTFIAADADGGLHLLSGNALVTVSPK